jgi:cbb3-type cytochrome oxidase subunit 3
VIPAAAQLKRGAGDAGSICGWLFLFQLAEKANLGMARNINVNDVASFDLDQFAGIAYKMQLRFLILHDLCLSPPILETVVSTVWRHGNSRCDRENIRLLLMIALPSSQPSFRGVWLFLFQLAGKENVGHAANINIKDVVSLVLDQLAGIAYKVQLRLFIFHGCAFLRQFSKNVLRPSGGHGKFTMRN